jgi:hypothetical protein
MGKIGLAFRAFFRVLLNRQVADEVDALFRHTALPKSDISAAEKQPPAVPVKPVVKAPARSDALTLLATLQREARLLDLVQEPLEQFQDAQVGAAARDVLRNSREVLARMFDIQPLLAQEEQSRIEIPPGFDAGQYRLTGNVHGEPPFRGTVQHRGWKASRCQVPEWTGGSEAALVVAPAEVELT